MRPAIIGLIVAVTIIMFLTQILNLQFVQSTVDIDFFGIAISPILLIVISGILGIIFY